MIKNQISGKEDSKNLYYQKAILVGYLRESLVASLFAKRLSKAIKVKQSGNQKISKTISGKKRSIDSGIDVLIGEFNDLQKALNELEGDESQELNLDTLKTFGIQVKSWLGKSDDISSPDFSLGNRKNVFDQFLDSEYINNHIDNINMIGKSMLFFNENTQAIKEVLGPANVAWVTGNNFYFTDDFIMQHRTNGYLFAFAPKAIKKEENATYSDPNSYQLTQKVRFLKLSRGLNETKK